MANSWYQGGIQRIIENADYLPGQANVNMSLVTGTTIQVDRDAITLADFIVAGTGNVLATDSPENKDRQVSSSGISQGWSPANARFEWSLNGPVNFGVVNVATAISGVVFYTEALSVSPGVAIVIGSQQKAITGLGGNVTWGVDGNNVISHWTPRDFANDVTAFRGSIEEIVGKIDPWDNTLFDIGFALIRDTNTVNPDGTEVTMADFGPSGKNVTYCTNGDPASSVANLAVLPGASAVADRISGWKANVVDAPTDDFSWHFTREAEGSGGQEVKFPQTGGAGGALTPGQVVDAVISFIFPVGAYSDATAFPLNWDFGPSKTIQSGQDLIYGNTASGRVNTTFVKVV